MQNGGDNMPSIRLLKSFKLKVLLYLFTQKLWENIKHWLKIVVFFIGNLIGELFLLSLQPFSNFFSNGLFNSPTRAARVTSDEAVFQI